MPWYEESDDPAPAATFRDVSRGKRADLTWAGGASADVASLRPPRLPNIAGAAYAYEFEAEGADEEPSGLHSRAGAAESEGAAGAVVSAEPVSAPAPEPRRVDTMIDEIIPRAEEEAFVAIRDAVRRAEAEREKQFAEVEQRLVDLAILVARRVIAREVSLDPGIVLGLVREGVQALGEQDRLVVRVGTFFAEMRGELQEQLASAKMRCEVIVDATLGQSGCVVETDLGSVDESIDARLATLVDGLSFDGTRKPR
jgi:hypothetical protein